MTTGKKRVFSLGGKAVLKLVVLVGVLLLANVLAVNLQFGWDASEGRTHSLADSTVALLGKLKGPVHLLVFANRWDRRAEKMLQRFHKANPMVSFEFVDPEAEPAKAKSHEVSGPGVTIVQMGPAKRRLRTLKEQTLAGAILQLAKGRGRKIVFSEGHDEREMAGADKECLGKASALLRAAGYETVQTSLTDDALKGAAVVVVARPRKEISAKEAARVREFVAGTSLFTTNRFFGLGGSRGFWEAAVSWLAGDLDYPLIAQKEPSKKLDLTDTQLRTVLIVCVLVLPGISAGLGLVVFIRRTE